MVNLSVEHVRRLCVVARETIAAVPAESGPGSPRRSDETAVRSAKGGGGRERAGILQRLSIHCAAAAGQCTFLANGVADLMDAATSRDNELNTAASASVVRSALEVAGQVVWLLDKEIGPHERCRRFLVWRLADVQQLRNNIASGGVEQDLTDAALAACNATEEKLLESADAARWRVRPHELRPNGTVAAAVLLDDAGKPVDYPGYARLVTGLTGPGVYSSLSASAHGQQHSTLAATTIDPDTGHASITGSVHDPASLIRWAILAAAGPALRLGSWNGVDLTRLQRVTGPA
jgi:hypothetical protein